MGGLIGMALANLPSMAAAVSPSVATAVSPSMATTPNSGMRRFVVNDIGPEIERAALERIAVYLSARPPSFPDYLSLFNAAQPAIAPFGPLSDEQRHHIISTSSRRGEDGLWTFKTDPKIGEAFAAGLATPSVDLWPLWKGIKQPTLIVRGEHSDLLSIATLQKMLDSKSSAKAITIADTGHAPMLMDAPTISRIERFLLSEPAA
jgi:pimeloyl-ACP methyl ester carboxylesterase